MKNLRQVSLVVLALSLSSLAQAEEAQKKSRLLGKKVLVNQAVNATNNEVVDGISQNSVESTSTVNLFGKKIEIVKSSIQYQVSENEGLSYKNSFYVKGRKVLAEDLIDGDGSLSYSVEVPANEINMDLFNYSIGILSVGVTSGLSYEGSLKAEVSSEFLKPSPVITPDMNLVQASAEVDVMAKGFVEGQAKILFIKGAIGGSLNLIDGHASASIGVRSSNITQPVIAYDGMVHLLSGEAYGYLGTGNSRWWQKSFFKSNGQCFAFGDSSCPN